MPFTKLKGRNTGLYRGPSGRTFTKRQVLRYYARGQTFDSPAEFYCDAVKRTSDPTGTIDIRKRFIAMLDTRWRTARGAVQKQVVDADVLGLKPDTVSPLAGPVKFQAWLDNLLKRVVVGDAAWMRVFMQAAYNRAIKRAMRLTQTDVVPKDQTETVNALSVMCLTELQGIAEAVSQRVMRAASNAWLHNEKPRDAFRDMDAAFAAVGKVRSSAMAEFLVVKSFNTATLDQFAAVGVERVGLIPESLRKPRLRKDAKLGANVGPGSRISREEVPSATTIRRIRKMQAQLEEDLPDEVDVVTAGDDLVCQECEDIEAEGPYTIDEARSLIPAHPRCRCAFAPVDKGILSSIFGKVKGFIGKLFGRDFADYNENHDPATGQFTSGEGGTGSAESDKDRLANYVGDSRDVNAALRNGTPLSAENQATIKALDHMMGPIDHDKVYRVFGEDHVEAERVAGLRVGDRYTDKAYMSTTHSAGGIKAVAAGLRESGDRARHIMVIGARGVKGIDVNAALGSHVHATQDEILLARGTTLVKTAESTKVLKSGATVTYHSMAVV